MARFRAFRGIRFSAEGAGALDRLVAPPYDVISVDRRDELLESSPHNVTRLILNPDGHGEAAALWRRWQSDGVLRRETARAFYLYRQDFDWHGAKTRTGVIGAMHLEPFATGVVRPHERTFAHHKRDRLELTKQVRANLSPIFGLYSNAEADPQPDGGWDSPPDVDVVHDGVRNRVWVVRSAARIAAIEAAVGGRTVFIADGHHRYETALNYYAETHADRPLAASGGPDDDQEPAAHVLTFLARFEDPGMLILPTHRELVSSGGVDQAAFVADLERRFEVTRFERSPQGRRALLATLGEESYDRNALGVALRGGSHYLLLRSRPDAAATGSLVSRLDVSVLHDVIIDGALAAAGAREPKLEYSHVVERVLDRVEDGITEAAFLLRPMRAQDMAEACMAGELMPHKSTFFYPKLLTGLVFHTLER